MAPPAKGEVVVGAELRRSSRQPSAPERLTPSLSARAASLYVYLFGKNDWSSAENRAGPQIDLVNLLKDETLPPRVVDAATGVVRWLLPATDKAAVRLAREREALARSGWTVLSSAPALVESLNNKAMLRATAARLGLLRLLPAHFSSPQEATYPCVLKPAVGEYGEGVMIVRSAGEVAAVAAAGLGRLWVLQEMVTGCRELCLSLLLVEGVIQAGVRTTYVYDCDEYVWPRVTELRKERSSEAIPVDDAEATLLARLLVAYTGVCNLNYKRRPGGHPAVFEVNARVGADLACDVPAPMLKAMLFALPGCLGGVQGQANGKGGLPASGLAPGTPTEGGATGALCGAPAMVPLSGQRADLAQGTSAQSKPTPGIAQPGAEGPAGESSSAGAAWARAIISPAANADGADDAMMGGRGGVAAAQAVGDGPLAICLPALPILHAASPSTISVAPPVAGESGASWGRAVQGVKGGFEQAGAAPFLAAAATHSAPAVRARVAPACPAVLGRRDGASQSDVGADMVGAALGEGRARGGEGGKCAGGEHGWVGAGRGWTEHGGRAGGVRLAGNSMRDEGLAGDLVGDAVLAGVLAGEHGLAGDEWEDEDSIPLSERKRLRVGLVAGCAP